MIKINTTYLHLNDIVQMVFDDTIQIFRTILKSAIHVQTKPCDALAVILYQMEMSN